MLYELNSRRSLGAAWEILKGESVLYKKALDVTIFQNNSHIEGSGSLHCKNNNGDLTKSSGRDE